MVTHRAHGTPQFNLHNHTSHISIYKQNAILRQLGLTVKALPKQTVKVFF